MNYKRLPLILVITACAAVSAFSQDVNKPVPIPVTLMTAEELKAKFASNEPITVIDVRSSEGYANSDQKIKGAIHIKLRRLKSRLSFSPLKDVPRDRVVVTYCACPEEHSSIAAAQILLSNGFKNVRALKGGWKQWLKISGPVETRAKG